MFCRYFPASLPVPNGRYRDIQPLGHTSPAAKVDCSDAIERVLLIPAFGVLILAHVNTLTRFVFINQHHVLTLFVLNVFL